MYGDFMSYILSMFNLQLEARLESMLNKLPRKSQFKFTISPIIRLVNALISIQFLLDSLLTNVQYKSPLEHQSLHIIFPLWPFQRLRQHFELAFDLSSSRPSLPSFYL